MKKTKNSYKKSGVNIETANKLVDYIAKYSKRSFKTKKNNFNNIGGFGSVFDLKPLKPCLKSTPPPLVNILLISKESIFSKYRLFMNMK